MQLTMARPNLHDRIDQLEKHFDKEISKLRKYVDKRITPIHDFFIGEKAVKEAQLNSQIKSGDIRISKEAWWLIVKILGFTGTAIAIVAGVVNAQS